MAMLTGTGKMSVELFGQSFKLLTFPKMIVFDVDYTLWPYWVDTHTSPPYSCAAGVGGWVGGAAPRRHPASESQDTVVQDSTGQVIQLFKETDEVICGLKQVAGLQLAYASRTGRPVWLEDLARLVPFSNGQTMWDNADHHEIYPGSKIKHFKRLALKSGISTNEMLFFDDEPGSNMEVTSLGVTFVNAEGGMSKTMLLRGLEAYCKEHAARGHPNRS